MHERENDFENNKKEDTSKFKIVAAQVSAIMATNIMKFNVGCIEGLNLLIVGELYKKDAEIKMSLSELSWFSSYCFAVPISSIVIGFLTQSIGQRRIFYIALILATVANLLYYYASNSAMLLIGSAIVGVNDAVMLGPGYTYIVEISQPYLRTMFLVLTAFTSMLGIILTLLLSNFVHWRTITIFYVIFPILAMIGTFVSPESPYWLASRGRFDEAERSLAWLRGWDARDNVKLEFTSIKENLIKNTDLSKKKTKDIFKPYLSKSFYIPAIIICYVMMIHALTGGLIITVFSIVTFEKMKAPIEAKFVSVIHYLFRFLGTIATIILAHILSKRKLLFISVTTAGIAYLLASLFTFLTQRNILTGEIYLWISAIMIMLSAFATSVGVDKILFMLNSEIFPIKLRNVGAGLGVFIVATSNSIIRMSFLYMLESIGIEGIFLLFGISCFFGLVTFYYVIPETDGKTLQEIENNFKGIENSSTVDVRK